jgi:ATP-binding cassette subfamily F protein 3
MFIDRVAKVIIEMEDGELTRYPGNYSNYLVQKALDLEKQASAYARQQKDIQRLEDLIEKFRYKKNKAKFAQSKIKYLDRLERIDPVKKEKRTFHADFHARIRGGKQVLLCQNYTVGYDRPLVSVNLELLRNQNTAIIGPNGHGKSTFLKTLIGKLEPLAGEVLWGHQIEIGYFDQEQVEYTSENTVLEDLWDEYPDLTHSEVRTVLGSFLFRADEVFKDVRVLSGGEKVRLALAKLMLKQANLLILDEPTNHLDIPAKEALEKSLANYEGTILFVSHDRYFIQKMAKAVLNIEVVSGGSWNGHGKLDLYIAGYGADKEEAINDLNLVYVNIMNKFHGLKKINYYY